MVLLLISSIVIFVVTLERLPDEIRVSSGKSSGLYHKVVSQIIDSVHQRSGVSVVNVESNGSLANLSVLESGEAEFAIVQ